MTRFSRPHVMYIVPVGQNPTGSVSTAEIQMWHSADKSCLIFRQWRPHARKRSTIFVSNMASALKFILVSLTRRRHHHRRGRPILLLARGWIQAPFPKNIWSCENWRWTVYRQPCSNLPEVSQPGGLNSWCWNATLIDLTIRDGWFALTRSPKYDDALQS